MPIHDQSYRHWEGTFKSHTFRWWIIAREGLRIILRQKLLLVFILTPPAIHFFVTGGIIYAASVFPAIPNLNIVNPKFFFEFFMRQIFFIAPICVFGGSGLVANDLKNNALQLYLSKPLTRLDYLAGKLAIVMILVGFLTMVPGILLFAENVVVSKDLAFLKEKYWVVGSIMAFSIILTLPTGFLNIALSSATKNNRYAAIAFIAILVGTPLFSQILNQIFRIESAVFISYWSNLDMLGKRLFGLSGYPDNWYWAITVIIGIISICVWIMYRKVKGVEIIK